MMASPPQAAQSMTYFLLQGLQLLFDAVNRKKNVKIDEAHVTSHTRERKDLVMNPDHIQSEEEEEVYTHSHIEPKNGRM